MKRTLFLLIVAIGIVAISTGCSSGDTQVLEDKISQLEQQLNSQNASSSNSTTASSNTSSQNDATNAATSSAPAQNNNSQQTNTNFDTTELSNKVESVAQLADSTQPKSTYSENVNLYGQVKMQIEQVEFELEQFNLRPILPARPYAGSVGSSFRYGKGFVRVSFGCRRLK